MENERRKYWFGEAILAIIAAALVANAIRTGRLVPTEAEVNAALSHANPDEIEKYIEQMPVLPGAESLYQTLKPHFGYDYNCD